MSLPGALPSLAPKRPEEVELFPAFKGSDAGWAAARGTGEAAANGKFSAFLGDYVAVATEPVAPAAPAGRCGGRGGGAARAPAHACMPPAHAQLILCRPRLCRIGLCILQAAHSHPQPRSDLGRRLTAAADKLCGAHAPCPPLPHSDPAAHASAAALTLLLASLPHPAPASPRPCLAPPLPAPPACPGRRALTWAPRSARAWARACSPTTCLTPMWRRRWALHRSWRRPASRPSWCRCADGVVCVVCGEVCGWGGAWRRRGPSHSP